MINADNSIKVDGLEKSIIDKCKQRIIAIAVIFFVSFIVVNIKLIEVSKPLKVKNYSDKTIKTYSKRGDILDRNGNIVAISMPSWSLYKDKNKIYDIEKTKDKILNIIPNLDKVKLGYILNEDKNFQYIARHLSPNVAKNINKIGKDWIRLDEQAGIDVSESGWDSEMIEYAYVFLHKDKTYMIYNGNEYGTSGFGLAILENIS